MDSGLNGEATMARQRLCTVLNVWLVLILSISCAPCWMGRASSWEEKEPALQEPDFGPLTAKKAYHFAQARAQRWHGDARLVDVYMTIASNQVESGPDDVTYVFRIDAQRGRFHWIEMADIRVLAEGRVTVGTYGSTEDKYDHSTSLDLEAAVWDSSDAFGVAEARGGKNYRLRYPDARVQIRAEAFMPDRIIWNITYCTEDVSGYTLSFGVDSKTGEVLRRHNL